MWSGQSRNYSVVSAYASGGASKSGLRKGGEGNWKRSLRGKRAENPCGISSRRLDIEVHT